MNGASRENFEHHLKVGEVAESCEVSIDTVRFDEARGLIPEPPRVESSGYRAYTPETIERIQCIQNAKDRGFSLDEVRRLLTLRANDEASCDEVRAIARAKADEVRNRIERLERMLEGLESLTKLCAGDLPGSQCPFLEVLSGGIE